MLYVPSLSLSLLSGKNIFLYLYRLPYPIPEKNWEYINEVAGLHEVQKIREESKGASAIEPL